MRIPISKEILSYTRNFQNAVIGGNTTESNCRVGQSFLQVHQFASLGVWQSVRPSVFLFEMMV